MSILDQDIQSLVPNRAHKHTFYSYDLELELIWWTWCTNLTGLFWRWICQPKMNFLGQGFWKLEHYRLKTLPCRIRGQ